MPRSAAGVVVLVLVVLTVGCATVQQAAIEDLIQTAASPSDHIRIAEYYRAEAVEARQTADDHRRLAASYGGRQSWGVAFAERARAHCMTLARLEENRAISYELLAAEHERRAEE